MRVGSVLAVPQTAMRRIPEDHPEHQRYQTDKNDLPDAHPFFPSRSSAFIHVGRRLIQTALPYNLAVLNGLS
jgi:hypothetical protein